MSVVSDLIDLAPDPAQLARVAARPAPAAPTAWLPIGAIAVALGLSLSLALPPARRVTNGSVSGGSVSAEAMRGERLHVTATPADR